MKHQPIWNPVTACFLIGAALATPNVGWGVLAATFVGIWAFAQWLRRQSVN